MGYLNWHMIMIEGWYAGVSGWSKKYSCWINFPQVQNSDIILKRGGEGGGCGGGGGGCRGGRSLLSLTIDFV